MTREEKIGLMLSAANFDFGGSCIHGAEELRAVLADALDAIEPIIRAEVEQLIEDRTEFAEELP